ncbi:hypothetical protein ABZ912_15105 [Nonomuraea angiospora]
MIATVLLIVLMVVAVAATEVIMWCSVKSKESVESAVEITGD